MEQTSRLSIIVDVNNAEQSIRRLEQRLTSLQTSGTNTARLLNNLGAANGLNGVAASANRSAGALHHLATSASGVTNNFNRFGATINNNVTIINRLTTGAHGATAALTRLQSMLVGGIYITTALSIAKTADNMQNLHSQIKLVTKSAEEYQVIQARLHEMANKNLSSLQATISLYTNSARSLSQLGKSQEEVLRFTNAVSLAMGVGGKSAQEQAAALLQLGQAMQSGILQGDEFRSIAENAPILLDLVAEKLKKTRHEVREMSKEGKITAEVMYQALSDATPRLQKMFDSMPITMAQAFGIAKNNYNKFVHEFINNTTGLSGAIAKAIGGISNNFDTLAKVTITTAGLAFVQFASRVAVSSVAMRVFNTVVKANPFVLLATAVLAVSGAFYGLDDVLGTTGILFKDLFDLATKGLSGLLELTGTVASDIVAYFTNSNKQSSNSFNIFFKDTEKGFLGLVQAIMRVVASITATLGGFFKWMGNGVWQAVRGSANAFIWLRNIAESAGVHVINALSESLDVVAQAINQKIMDMNGILSNVGINVQLPQLNVVGMRVSAQPMPYFAVEGKTLGANIADMMGVTIPMVDEYARSVANRMQAQKQMPTVDLSKPIEANTRALNQNTDTKKKDKEKKQKELKDSDKYKPAQVNATVLRHARDYNYSDIESRYGLPQGLLAAVSMQESRGNANATSPKGAKGEFQFIPITAKEYGILGQERNTAKAAEAAAKYLNKLYKEFGDWNKVLAAYNAGEGNVKKYKGIPPFKETQNYVKNVRSYLAFMNGSAKINQNPNDVIKAEQHYLEQQRKEQERIDRERRDILGDLNTKRQNEYIKYQEKSAEIERLWAGDTEKITELKTQLANQWKAYSGYQDKLLEFETKSHTWDVWYRLAKELELKQAEIDTNIDLTPEEKALYKNAEGQKHAQKTAETMQHLREQELEINGWRKTAVERLKLERDIATGKIQLNNELTEKDKQAWIKSTEAKYERLIAFEELKHDFTKQHYDFEIYQFNMTEDQKIVARTNIALAELAAREDLIDEVRELEEQAIKAKYQYEINEFEKTRNKVLADTVADYARLRHISLNFKDKYAGVKYDLDKDGHNKQYQSEVADYNRRIDALKEFNELRERLIDGSAFKLNLSSDVTGAYVEVGSEIGSLIKNFETIKNHRKQMAEDLEQDRKAGLISLAEYQERERALQEQHLATMAQLTLGGAGQFFGAISNLGKVVLGEQSSTYKELFRISKAFYITQATMEVYKAGSSAFAETPGSIWAKLAAAAKAVAQSTSFVNLISAVNLRGFRTGGYTGNAGVNDVAGVVHGQEYVINAKNTVKYRSQLEQMNKGTYQETKGVTNVIINNYTNNQAQVEQQPNGDFMITIGKFIENKVHSSVQQEFIMHQRQGYSLSRRR